MEELFLQILNMSITAGYVILAVLLMRLALRRAPRRYAYLLWLAPAFRLVCPISFESVLSLFSLPGFDMRRAQAGTTARLTYVPADIGMMSQPEITVGIPAANAALSQSLPAATPMYSANPMQIILAAASIIWAAGVILLLVWALISTMLLYRRMSRAVRMEGNVYACENVRSPFILGIFRPRIYVPYGLSGDALRYVLAHERCHLRRFDHIIRPLSFLIVTLHWFNPLVWAAYILMGRDMEMSCDESVLAAGEPGIRADYSETLLRLAASRRFAALHPLAFGESGVKRRIKNILRWKKPALWLTLCAVVLCIAVFFVCAANPTLRLDPADVTAVVWNGETVSRVGQDALIELLVQYRRSPYRSGDAVDDIRDAKETTVTIETTDAVYTLDYRYWSGFSFDPRHFGEDDYHSILTRTDLQSGKSQSWKMAFEFDEAFEFWLDIYTTYEQRNIVAMTTTDLIIGETYVSSACLYMNSLSSYASFGGDSGQLYTFTDSSLVITPRNDFYSSATIPVESWDWQEFPYSDDEWNALYVPEGFYARMNINEDYENILYHPLAGKEHFLLQLDGMLWLVETRENDRMGRFIWSIYALLPEYFMGSANWTCMPTYNHASPEFRFTFDMEISELSFSCVNGGEVHGGKLSDLDDRAIYWSPMSENNPGGALYADSTCILFSFKDTYGAFRSGTLYIEQLEDAANNHFPYRATIVATDLRLEQDDYDGGRIIYGFVPEDAAETMPSVNLTALFNDGFYALPELKWDMNPDEVAQTLGITLEENWHAIDLDRDAYPSSLFPKSIPENMKGYSTDTCFLIGNQKASLEFVFFDDKPYHYSFTIKPGQVAQAWFNTQAEAMTAAYGEPASHNVRENVYHAHNREEHITWEMGINYLTIRLCTGEDVAPIIYVEFHNFDV